jgi:hypothetical protein
MAAAEQCDLRTVHTVIRFPFGRSLAFSALLLAGLASFFLAATPPASAQPRGVGVTSATDGDPLGRPPSLPERVLRIGIDVQANEMITTGPNDRAHLVFLDGSSLTVGPDAQLTVDKFVYDPNTKTGELALNASKGVFRLVGGRISKTTPIVVKTPSSTIGVRGGIALFQVTATFTTSTFAFGFNMTVTALGFTQNVSRPGFQITTAVGSQPGQPVAAPAGTLTITLALLEGKPGTSGGGSGGGSTVIVNGTQLLGSLQPTPNANNPTPLNYQNVQQWSAANNLSSGATNPGQLPSNNPGQNPNNIVMPPTQVVTYAGSMTGIDTKRGVFTGDFSLGWNFTTRSGNFNGSGGGFNISAPVQGVGNTALFAGPMSVTGTGGVTGSGTLGGAFTSSTGVAGAFVGTTSNKSLMGGVFSGTTGNQ